MKGLVIRSTGSWYTVQAENDCLYECRIKGKFRIKGIKTTNPVAVGDLVEFELMPNEPTGLIHEIGERRNYIIRKSTKLSKLSHIIASNLDQAFLVVTLINPRIKPGFIDRFLVTAEAYHIPASLIINKIDLYDEELQHFHNQVKNLYETIGYPCYEVSALRGDGLDNLRTLLQGKVTLLSGYSGVGKSALANCVQPGLNIRTGDISDYNDKGRHTTTFAQMHPLTGGGYIVDTPGIKEFGLINFDRQEICERFPEMRILMDQCKFNNCTHIHEPGCAVKEALAQHYISESRYSSYLRMLDDKGVDDGEW